MALGDHVGAGVRWRMVVFVGIVMTVFGSAGPAVGRSPTGAPADIVVVDPQGGGDHTTISAALTEADDGVTIMVRPGDYSEAVTIASDVHLRGEGAPTDVRLTITPDRPFRIEAADATLSSMTIVSRSSHGLEIDGGGPVLRDLLFAEVRLPRPDESDCPDGCRSMTISDRSTAEIIDSRFIDGLRIRVEGGAEPSIVGNVFGSGSAISLFDAGPDTVVEGNTLTGTTDYAIGVFRPTTATVEGNLITAFEGIGIEVGLLDGTDPVIRGNRISSGGTGVHVSNDAQPIIVGNRIEDNGTGIGLSRSSPVIESNRIEGNRRGIGIGRGRPTLRDNRIEQNEVGLDLTAGAEPSLSGNLFCGNALDIDVSRGTVKPDLDSKGACSPTDD